MEALATACAMLMPERGAKLTRRSRPKSEQFEGQLRREAIAVRGVVQGVGFRPFVYRLATEEGLAGFIGNDTGGVTIEIEGPA
jgi:hydrogenase maturation protein HypF